MSKECVFFAQATADSTSLSDSYSDVSESEQSASKRKRHAKWENYLAGKSRKVYKLSKDLEKSLEESEGASGVCSSCASVQAYSTRELTEVMQRHASVMFDSGGIVRCWRDVVSKKYSNLPGIRELHDFLALCNAGENATMMVRDNCYSGPLKTTPMSIRKGLGPQNRALLGVGDSYFAKGLAKNTFREQAVSSQPNEY